MMRQKGQLKKRQKAGFNKIFISYLLLYFVKIKKIEAKEIFDSRKEKTIEVSVLTKKGRFISSAPEGKSKGRFEAKPYAISLGKDILFLNNLKTKEAEKLKIEEFKDLREVEGLVNSKIGANSLFALEMGILKALAAEQGKELWQLLARGKPKKFPFPAGNCIGGGLHSSGKEKKPDFQEFLIIPKMKMFCDNVFLMKKAHEEIGKVLELRKAKGKLNDENAWASSLDNEECLEILGKVADYLSSEAGCKIGIGADVAASSFFKGKYIYKNKKQNLTREQQIKYIAELADNFGLFYIEDPLEEQDFSGFAELREKIVPIIAGDDLTVTSLLRLKKAFQSRSINAIIVKPNQNGSLLKVKEICDFCREKEIALVFSHRSGETLDNSLADLAVAWNADFIKTGIFGKEREAKLNRIIEIEKSL